MNALLLQFWALAKEFCAIFSKRINRNPTLLYITRFLEKQNVLVENLGIPIMKLFGNKPKC